MDGLLIDEGAFVGTPLEFNPTVVAEFNDYLATTMTVQERENLAMSLGFPNFAQFDYAQVWRDQLPLGTTELDEATWNNRLNLNIPLWAKYDRYRQSRGVAAMDRIVTAARAHALTLGREIPIGFNIGPAVIDGIPFVHLADFVDLEFIYAVPAGVNPEAYHYFPEGRGATTVKLLQAFGIKANLFAALPTVTELNTRGPGNIENAFKVMIADGYAAGGRFHVEETFIDLTTNFDEIAPYYRFVTQRADLFEDAGIISPRVGIVQLWEQYDLQPMRTLDGTGQMLADSGYQYDVIFGAEDVNRLFPSPPQVLDETLLAQYDALVIPGFVLCGFCGPAGNILMVTENHAGKLLNFVNLGGLLVVQAEPAEVANGISANTGPLANELLGYLQSGTRAVGTGVIVHIPQVLGPAYQTTVNSNDAQTVRNQLTSVLDNNGISAEVSYTGNPRAVSAYQYRANDYTVIHLVNYDHDIDTDSIASVSNLAVSIDIATLPAAADYSVTWQRPELPNGSALISQIVGDQLLVTVPVISPWSVLHIEPAI